MPLIDGDVSTGLIVITFVSLPDPPKPSNTVVRSATTTGLVDAICPDAASKDKF
jgi:hypothetical protein